MEPYLELSMATIVGLAVGVWIGVWISATLASREGLRVYEPIEDCEPEAVEVINFTGKACCVCGERASCYGGGEYKCSRCFFIAFDCDNVLSARH